MRKGALKLAIKFAMRSHEDHAYIKRTMMVAGFLPEYISPRRLNKAFKEVA